MNEAKLKRLIDDTAQMLNLNEAGKKYLDTVINMAYTVGSRDGLEEGQRITNAALSTGKTFKEKWEEARMK